MFREKGAETFSRNGLSKSILEPMMWKHCTTAAEMMVPSVWATSSGEFATDGPSMRKVSGSNSPTFGISPRKK